MPVPHRLSLRVSVLGARGMLGSDLVPALRRRGAEVATWDLPGWDIRRPEHIAQAIAGADAVINCAAYTNVEAAEHDRDAAFAVNAEAPGELARQTAAAGQFLIHISTDFVFDGRLDRPYRESDPPSPINVYGASKLAGEEAVRSAGGETAIVRVQWTYGRAGTNFIHKILDRAGRGGVLRVVADQRGAPTWTGDAAAALAELLEKRAPGLYHFAARGCASRFEIAKFLVHEKQLECTVVPCSSREFPQAAARPQNSCFDCSRIDALLSIPRPHWRRALRDYLDTL